MAALDGTLRHPGVADLCVHSRILPPHPSICRGKRSYCFAKVTVDDGEQKHEATRKGFSIRVPTIPNFGDVESARRMLESAFQALSFEMPKISIDSAALQGLTFDIFKLSFPKRVLVFDITGFVATRLKKPPKKVGDAEILNEGEYPRCAWPRISKEARIEEALGTGTLSNLQDQEGGANLVLEESMGAYNYSIGMRTMHRSPEINASELRERSSTPSALDVASLRAPVGPHCAWPRKSQAFSAESVARDVRYPHSAWPRKSQSGNGVVIGGQQSLVELNMRSAPRKEEVSPCIIEGGARCAWPRKTFSAKQSCGAESVAGALVGEGLQKSKDDCKIASADFNGAAELPRRMLATSVGLTLMNQLVKGSIMTPLFDFCSLLPGGSLEIADEEDVALDLGRRTLLVFIK